MQDNQEDTSTKATRVGRPKSEEKAAAVLGAAGELFLGRGFQATSMDAVAKRAEVSKQTVYSHYANKDELFKACMRNKVTSYEIGELTSVEGADLRAGLVAIARRFLALLTDPEVVAMHRVIMSEAATQPHVAELFFESGPVAAKTALSLYLQRQVTAGRLAIPPEKLQFAAVQLFAMAQGMYQLQLLLGLIYDIPEEELVRHLNQVVDDFLVLYAVKPRHRSFSVKPEDRHR
jgi:TetR/AcrR family transcriptional repressor of mexJK operon